MKGSNRLELAAINVGRHGMKDEERADELSAMIRELDIDVCAVAEHWRGEKERMRGELGVKESAEEKMETEHLLGDGFWWGQQVRKGGTRGGVGLAVKRGIGKIERLIEYEDEGLMWVCIERGERKLFVASVYFVPASSDWYAGNVHRRVRLAQGIARYEQQGRVVVMGDMNARIGCMSVMLQGEEEGAVVELYRQSEDTAITADGRRLLAMFSGMNMVVMNGVGGEGGQMTCEKKKGSSVVDWAVVPKVCMHEFSAVWIDDRGWMDTDHHLVRITWMCEERSEGQGRTVEDRQDGRTVISRKVPNVRGGRRMGWRGLRQQCDVMMRRWTEKEEREMKDGRDVEEMWMSWYREYEKIVGTTIGWRKKNRGKKRACKWDRQISMMKREMKRLTKEIAAAKIGDRRWLEQRRKTIRKSVRKRIRYLRRMAEWMKMREIEDLGRKGDKKAMWDRLKGGNKKAMGGDRTRMRDGEGGWVEGEELRRRWRNVFESVGKKLEACGGYDDSWRQKIEEEVAEGDSHEEGGDMDVDITVEEVRRVIRELRNGKAVGLDGVVGEIMREGGEWMVKSVWCMCKRMFVVGQVPDDWTKAVKVPIPKKGIGDRFEQYRGITLISVVSKVYAIVLEKRLRRWCEKKGVLVDEQMGFRQDRGTRDALFILDEVVRMRRKKERVYLGFLDISKAYPSVWWEGLWWKLRDIGVSGRMLAAIRSFYARCMCAVRVGGEAEDWFEDKVGVRQGCPLSPLLFAIYINNLAKDVSARGGSVKVGGARLGLLLFADDIVLFADSREGLQRSLNIAWQYSRTWRFNFNLGTSKSEVMVLGGSVPRERFWMGEDQMNVVREYCYLGIVLMEEGWWDKGRERLTQKANRALWKAVGMGMLEKGLSSDAACDIYETFVRPVCEYAGEILGERKWEEAEVLQRRVGRMILCAGDAVANEVVQGELGWWTVRGRLDFLRLMYYAKLATEESDLIRGVFESCRNRAEHGQKNTWCAYTRKLMVELGLELEWMTGAVGERGEWRKRIWACIQDREERRWRRGMVGKTTLVRYQRIKKRLRREKFLKIDGWAVKRLIRLRGGVERLEVVRGRRFRIRRQDRKCLVCCAGNVEDEDHFIEGCTALIEQRSRMWRRIEDVMKCRHKIGRIRAMTEEERVDWVLGTDFDVGHWKFMQLQKAVIQGIKELWNGRGRTGLVDATM